MRVLLLSAYAAGSHTQWQHSLRTMFPHWHWHVLSLPPRHFNWRVRGNALFWAVEEQALLNGDFDLLLATSMVDLATLRGLVPGLAAVPTAVYFHENQFAYPQREGQQGVLEAQITSLYTALAADKLLFNSQFNQDSFIAGCEALLARMPDFVPAAVPERLRGMSTVLPVPIEPPGALATGVSAWSGDGESYPGRPLRLQWLGRLEYDKGGSGLLSLLGELEQRHLDYELAVTGQRFRQLPVEFAAIEQEFSHRLVQFGYLDSRDDYLAQIGAADIVLSTAIHEFQGLAVLEAVAAGCYPVVPDGLAYQEIYPAQHRYTSSGSGPAAQASAAASLIQDWSVRQATLRQADLRQATLQQADLRQADPKQSRARLDVSRFYRTALQPEYEALLLGLAAPQDSQ